MKIYEVVIQATVTKTLTVQAESADEAVMLAHDDFTTAPEDEEDYEEQCVGVRVVKEAA